VSTDPSRPRLHFTPAAGWINDPLGLTWHDSAYHLFFQYVPDQNEWGPKQRWGHATSPDLLHWTEGPVALEPGEGDEGVWSGSIVVPQTGPAALFYTTVDLADVQVGKARLARPVDQSWTVWDKKDVVAEVPADLDVVAFRDPFVFHDGDAWRMLMGAGLADGTATALTYRSDDLETWRYDGLLATRHRSETEPIWMGAVWECPQLFRLGDRWVLTVSVWEPIVPYYEAYAIGDLVDGRFVAEHWGRLSYGPSYYAGSTYTDMDGLRGLIYWMRDVDDPAGAWASAHSVPHVLTLVGNRVVAEPHPAVVTARVGEGMSIAPDAVTAIDCCTELDWALEPGARAALALTDAEGAAVLTVEVSADHLTASTVAGAWTMPVSGGGARVLLDGPVVEIFTAAGVMGLPVPASYVAATASGSGSVVCHQLR
jgi:beta-fructofuranosidase